MDNAETVKNGVDTLGEIAKATSNDAIVITGLKPDSCNIKEWTIRPMRRKSQQTNVTHTP